MNKVSYLNIKKAGNPDRRDRTPFSTTEIQKLWKHKDANGYCNVILILIYTGCRISELLALKKEDINLQEKWFDIKKSKTAAGVRRVPIADKVLPFFEHWYNLNDCEYLISTPDGKPFEYRNLNITVRQVLPQLSVLSFLYYRKYSIINISKDMREAVKCQVHTVHYV